MIDALQVFVRGFEDERRREVIASYLTELGFNVEDIFDSGTHNLGGLVGTNVVYQDELFEADPDAILVELRRRTGLRSLWLQVREFHLSEEREYGRGEHEAG